MLARQLFTELELRDVDTGVSIEAGAFSQQTHDNLRLNSRLYSILKPVNTTLERRHRRSRLTLTANVHIH